LIFTAYGFWLPNDPRGSGSDYIRNWEILRFGLPTEVNVRVSVAHKKHDKKARLRAKKAMKFPPVQFTGQQALSIAKGFQHASETSNYKIYGCSILPEHIHMLVEHHITEPHRIIGHLKTEATRQLFKDNLHPMEPYRKENQPPPTPWGRRGWVVYLDTIKAINHAIGYIEQNPIKEGKRPQNWSFVRKF
jgi:REP element-mobilizing transposase RayT